MTLENCSETNIRFMESRGDNSLSGFFNEAKLPIGKLREASGEAIGWHVRQMYG